MWHTTCCCNSGVVDHGVNWIHILLIFHVRIDIAEQKITSGRQIGQLQQFGVVVKLRKMITSNSVIDRLLVLMMLRRHRLQLDDVLLLLLVGVRIGDGDDVGSGGCGGGVGARADGMHRLRRAVVLLELQLDGGGRRKVVVVELVQTGGVGRLQRLQLMQTVLRTAVDVVGGHWHVAAVAGGYWHKNVLLIHLKGLVQWQK